ncbi:hypothetical protein D3C78_519690 [compost metagenome]
MPALLRPLNNGLPHHVKTHIVYLSLQAAVLSLNPSYMKECRKSRAQTEYQASLPDSVQTPLPGLTPVPVFHDSHGHKPASARIHYLWRFHSEYGAVQLNPVPLKQLLRCNPPGSRGDTRCSYDALLLPDDTCYGPSCPSPLSSSLFIGHIGSEPQR